MHYYHYLLKLVVLLAELLSLNRILRVTVSLEFVHRTRRVPAWLRAAVEFFENEGWTVIPASILAAVWQIAERF